MNVMWNGPDMYVVEPGLIPPQAWPVIARHDEVISAVANGRVLVSDQGPPFLGECTTDGALIASLTDKPRT